jgi:hypothetical protein
MVPDACFLAEQRVGMRDRVVDVVRVRRRRVLPRDSDRGVQRRQAGDRAGPT